MTSRLYSTENWECPFEISTRNLWSSKRCKPHAPEKSNKKVHFFELHLLSTPPQAPFILLVGPHPLNKLALVRYNLFFLSSDRTRKRMCVCVVVSLRLLRRASSGVRVFAWLLLFFSCIHPSSRWLWAACVLLCRCSCSRAMYYAPVIIIIFRSFRP